MWGHTLDDFYWIERLPGIPYQTVWTTSMIQDHKEKNAELLGPQPEPRRLRPWPVLRYEGEVASTPPVGQFDESCDENHANFGKKVFAKIIRGIDDDGMLVEGDGTDPRDTCVRMVVEENDIGDSHFLSYSYHYTQ
jgi:hypothetical protein